MEKLKNIEVKYYIDIIAGGRTKYGNIYNREISKEEFEDNGKITFSKWDLGFRKYGIKVTGQKVNIGERTWIGWVKSAEDVAKESGENSPIYQHMVKTGCTRIVRDIDGGSHVLQETDIVIEPSQINYKQARTVEKETK